jgi:hypothetical protein
MAKKSDKGGQEKLAVYVQYISVADAQSRLSRAINILLNSAARNVRQQKETSSSIQESPPRLTITEGTEGHVIKEGHNHEG